MLNLAPLLQVALLKLRAFFTFQVETRLPQRSVDFSADLSTVNFLSGAHYFSFLWAHLHPALGVFLEDLAILRRHGEPTLTRVTERRSAMRLRHRHSSDAPALLTMRLSIGSQRPNQHENRNQCDSAYKV